MPNDNNTWASPEMWPGYPLDGDMGQEFIVSSPGLLYDEATIEKYEKIIDELNSLGCTSFTITSDEIKSLLNKKDVD